LGAAFQSPFEGGPVKFGADPVQLKPHREFPSDLEVDPAVVTGAFDHRFVGWNRPGIEPSHIDCTEFLQNLQFA